MWFVRPGYSLLRGSLYRDSTVVVGAFDCRSEYRKIGGSEVAQISSCVVSLDIDYTPHCLSPPCCTNVYKRTGRDWHPIQESGWCGGGGGGRFMVLLVALCYVCYGSCEPLGP